jgi:hypothetical protein
MRGPTLTLGRIRFELRPNGKLWMWHAVGRSGLRWKLSPGEFEPSNYGATVREWVATIERQRTLNVEPQQLAQPEVADLPFSLTPEVHERETTQPGLRFDKE